jgi:hypothetical protein
MTACHEQHGLVRSVVLHLLPRAALFGCARSVQLSIAVHVTANTIFLLLLVPAFLWRFRTRRDRHRGQRRPRRASSAGRNARVATLPSNQRRGLRVIDAHTKQ